MRKYDRIILHRTILMVSGIDSVLFVSIRSHDSSIITSIDPSIHQVMNNDSRKMNHSHHRRNDIPPIHLDSWPNKMSFRHNGVGTNPFTQSTIDRHDFFVLLTLFLISIVNILSIEMYSYWLEWTSDCCDIACLLTHLDPPSYPNTWFFRDS